MVDPMNSPYLLYCGLALEVERPLSTGANVSQLLVIVGLSTVIRRSSVRNSLNRAGVILGEDSLLCILCPMPPLAGVATGASAFELDRACLRYNGRGGPSETTSHGMMKSSNLVSWR